VRVLHVIPSMAARTGGPAAVVAESSAALREYGVESAIFATDMAEAASAQRHGRVRATDLPAAARRVHVRLHRAREPYRLAFAPSLLRSLLREAAGYDVIHIHSLFLFPQLAAFLAARRAGVPYVVSPRGALDPWLRRRRRVAKAVAGALWQAEMLRGASAIHVTSEEEGRLIEDVAPLVPRATIPNGIVWRDFQRVPEGDAFGSRSRGGGDGPVVLYLGRLSHKKGLDTLIRAFALVAREEPRARLVIAGPDDEGLRPRLDALAAAEGVGRGVTFAGMLAGDERLAALAAADVWALPSHSENFGLAVVEAMAAGRAVVVSPGVNIARELGEAGAAVVAEASPARFADAIRELIGDPGRRRNLGGRAREYARRYDWQQIAPQLAAMYEEVSAA